MLHECLTPSLAQSFRDVAQAVMSPRLSPRAEGMRPRARFQLHLLSPEEQDEWQLKHRKAQEFKEMLEAQQKQKQKWEKDQEKHR